MFQTDENTNSENTLENHMETATENPETPATETAAETSENPLQHLQAELEDSKTKLQELTIISQQALADLQNYKKRTQEEKTQIFEFANSNLINEILPVLDNIERASQHIPEEAKDWAMGIMGITKQLEDILNQQGLSKINSKGQAFNPHIHEAIATENGEKDLVINEIQTGYLFKEKVLRPAKVTVGNGENNPTNTTEQSIDSN